MVNLLHSEKLINIAEERHQLKEKENRFFFQILDNFRSKNENKINLDFNVHNVNRNLVSTGYNGQKQEN